MLSQFPERAEGTGYMWMSGTSFAAPVVSGIAATIFSRHPEWTPDQVKGALMVSSGIPDWYTSDGAMGVGIVNGTAALGTDGLANPNAGLNQFVSTDGSTGLPTFNTARRRSDGQRLNSASWSAPVVERPCRRLLVERVLELRLVVERVVVERVVVEQHRRAGLLGEQREVRRPGGVTDRRKPAPPAPAHSHSIVAGGFDETS
jgi:hypothetical protein